MTFGEWRRSVDQIMLAEYCIHSADAGLSEGQLRQFWADDEDPREFVEWFAEKYDLTHRSEWGWGGIR
jgi:hypothetical protein